MKRLAVLTGAAALVAGMGTVTPASAHPGGVCVAVAAKAYLSTGVYYPPILTANVGFDITADPCTASGMFQWASCGNSFGSGVIDDGDDAHSITIVTAGGVVTVAGEAAGTFTAVPDAANGESCVANGTNDGASVFIVTGSAVTA